jgi:hypothetical protein
VSADLSEHVTSVRPGDFAPPAELAVLGRRALGVGVVAALAAAAGAYFDVDGFLRAWLVAWLLWFSVAAGSLGLLLIQHLSGGRWGIALRRPMEAAARTLPAVGLAALPLVFGLGRLYLWADPARVHGDALLEHKAVWLNPTAFVARTVAVLAIFTLFAWLLSRRSARQDEHASAGLAWSLQKTSGIGLLVFVVIGSLFAFDWLMSLDPYWYSSLYGAIFLAGAVIAALTFLILAATWLARREPMAKVYTGKRFHDFGTLLFAAVMFFTYLAISNFIIAYQGNLPEEVVWYKERFHGYWAWVATGLLVLHFFFPFLILLSRAIKRNPVTLARIALFVLFMRWVDLVWQTRPTFVHEGLPLTWLDLAAPVALGGLWIFLFTRELARRSLLPVGDRAIGEVLGHE